MLAMNIRYLLLFSAIFRMILIIYGEWQDSHMEVRYTDVDYLVFSDAASFMASGDSPYKRTTYRYSPLLAFLLIPNSFIHHSWGKFLFSASDLLVGLFIHTILKLRRVPEDLCMYSVMVWLFNPFTFTIGTRGNCEPIVCAMILWIIICLMNGNVLQAAFWYGLVVHFRIYPIIYALPIILVLDPHSFQSGLKPKLLNWSSSQVKTSHSSNRVNGQYDLSTTLKSLFSMRRIMFGLVSGSVFLLCTSLFFYLYRWEFLHEALLYHLTRTDPRHNFSIYFYHIYLHSEHEFSVLERLISFLPQFIVQLVLMFSFAQDLPFCLFLQTVAFVAFNKVHNQLCFFMKRLDASSIRRNISKEATYTFALIDLMRVALRFLFGVNLICSILFSLFEAIFNCPVFDFNITARTVSLQVITAQYFVWFFCLLPLILPWSKMKLKWEGLCCILVWMGAQTHWLMWAYMLEFKGKNVFVQLWLASILFLAANSFVLILIIRRHKFSPVFERWDQATSKNAAKLK